MTWLSRLLPQSPSLQRLVDHNHRTRQGKRRRRMATLELLEDRTLLSNITVSQDLSTEVVTILGDTYGDQFKVTVNLDNTISVVGTDAKTQVNNFPPGVAWNSLYPALGLTISLPGNGNVNDVVALQGQGNGVITEIKSISVTVAGTEPLVFIADGIHTSTGPGTFTLTDGTSSAAGGQLSAIVTNSQFASLSLSQTGCCPAYVELDNDLVVNAVSVTEGLGEGDGIVLDGDHFGSTTLIQGDPGGPTMQGCNGDGDFVTVNDANLIDLTIDQEDNGPSPAEGVSIKVGLNGEVEVALTSFGILATQDNGGGDLIEIVSITTSGKPTDNLRNGPDNIITSQGNGNGDSAVVDSSCVWGNIESTQGNGNGDCVAYLGDSAGWTTVSGPSITDYFGLASITQLNGYNDTATLDCSQIETQGDPNCFNNVLISQGVSLTFVGCSPGLGDVINVNCTNVVSDLTLEQGVGDTTGVGLGNNVVNIATTSAVTVGDSTVINEIGANNGNNQIDLGGASGSPDSGSIDFETDYLDVYTGAGGGVYVQVWNTQVDVGALGTFGPYNMNGDGDGNTSSLDDFSSFSVTINVQKAIPVLTWANPADITYGTALDGTQLNATSSVPGSFVYTPALGTVLSAGAGQTLSVTFTPTDTVNYTSVTATAIINVSQAQLTVAADDKSMTYGSSVPALTDTITGFVSGDDASVVSGTPVLSPTASSSSDPGSYPITVGVSGLSATNYSFAAQDGTLTIGTATPVLTWANPADITYGAALSATQLDATASVPGTFTYTPAAGAILGAGNNQTLSVAFTPTDTTDYTTATATATINVLPATPTISWANPANIVYGTALSATQLDATASVPGTFTYTPAAGAILAPATTRPCRSLSLPTTRPTTPRPPQPRRSTSCQRRRRSPGPIRRTSSTARA